MGNGKKKLIFFGTSEICIPFLESLKSEFEIILIITQPDSHGGRKNKLIEPEVKKYAVSEGIEFIQPEKLNNTIADKIKEIDPVIAVVISYGKFIPGKIFKIPEFNTVNVHFSLLPELRGAAPYQRAIEQGMEGTGITIFEISREMDAGDIWATKKFDILPDDTSESLSYRMGIEGAPFLTSTIHNIISGKIKKEPQDHSSATRADIVSKNESKLDWKQPAKVIYNKFRSFFPWPGIFFTAGGKKIVIKDMKVSKDKESDIPGRVLSVSKECLRVCCGEGTIIEIISILPQGKREMTPYTFSQGNKIPEKLD